MHAARVLADSVSPRGIRLTTIEGRYPRIVLAEKNTHRALSRNSGSSRALPTKKMLAMIREAPYIPSIWGTYQSGMQGGPPLVGEARAKAEAGWLRARDAMIEEAEYLLSLGVEKGLTNRLLEPFMWHTVIVTATEWDNFLHLRCHKDAHNDIRLFAEKVQEALHGSSPRELAPGEWHLPLFGGIDDEPEGTMSNDAVDYEWARKVSVGRCTRVSYLTHDGRRDPQEDIGLHDRILKSGHMSPFEHVARPMTEAEFESYHGYEIVTEKGSVYRLQSSVRPVVGANSVFSAEGISLASDDRIVDVREGAFCGNFNGWVQYRKTLVREYDPLGVPRE